jgi:hypothetical protein
MTVNDDIFDATVTHQVAVNVAGGDSAKRVAAELDRVNQQLLSDIVRFEPGESNRGRDAILRRIEASEASIGTTLLELVTADMLGVAEEEEGFNEALLIPLLLLRGVQLRKPRLIDIRREVIGTEFHGPMVKLGTARAQVREFARRRAARLASEVRLARLGEASSGQIIRDLRGTRNQGFRNGAFAQMRRDIEGISLGGTIHSSNVASGMFAAANPRALKEVWIAILDGRACAVCAARHNRKFLIGQGPVPPAHVRCRCFRIKVIPGMTFKSMSFDEWLKTKPRKTVEQVLGKSRARLFLEGGLEIRRFVDNPFRRSPASRILTLDELRASGSVAVREALSKAGLVD